MSPVASRNMVTALIVVGLVPVLLWLYGLAFLVMHPGELLPWTAAGIIVFGAPMGFISLVLAVPVMIYARSRATQNKAVWTRIHRIPFYFGLVTLATALISGGVLIAMNMHR
jgi:hypothetical protein